MMRLRCTACGAKIRRNDCVCPECGYELYSSELKNIAREVEYEMKSISEVQLASIQREFQHENNNNPQKLTLEEFEAVYIKKNNIKKPRRSANIFALFMKLSYDSMIKQAYEEYLRGLGYNQ